MNWKNPLYYRPKAKPRPQPVLSEEERAAQKARMDKIIEDFVAAANASVKRPANTSPLEKIIDQDARKVVEGDTDLNHDDLEGGE